MFDSRLELYLHQYLALFFLPGLLAFDLFFPAFLTVDLDKHLVAMLLFQQSLHFPQFVLFFLVHPTVYVIQCYCNVFHVAVIWVVIDPFRHLFYFLCLFSIQLFSISLAFLFVLSLDVGFNLLCLPAFKSFLFVVGCLLQNTSSSPSSLLLLKIFQARCLALFS